jgi:SPP1 gp7 family putative phage head morphogenesis protein
MAVLPLTRRGEFQGWGIKGIPTTEGEFRRLYRRMHQIGRNQQQEFLKAHAAATSYAARLRSVAQHISDIVDAYAPEKAGEPWSPGALARMDAALRDYAEAIEPWAQAVSWRMVKEVEQRNWSAWNMAAQQMAAGLRHELAHADLGPAVQGLLAGQVDLITSLPLEASQRVHEASLEAQVEGTRYAERVAGVEAALAETPSERFKAALAKVHPDNVKKFMKNRATLIARTETARSASVITQARAEAIGSTQYTWLTAGDWKVRPSHQRLNGHVFEWADPPLSDPPDHHSHPGQIFNCRCVAIPIIPPQ